ncbi:MAG: sigma-70 family RNA polymerase sigma factor [Bacteroidaceae bacterium]|nr:sigma-70 family RNA polymerase sigma factor [Bacteroidaceae bacterium]
MIDETILEGLFRQYYGEMMRVADTLLYTDEEAEDVVQDVFVRLMEVGALPCEGKMRAYLLTAVRNGCLNRMKQKTLKERVHNLYSLDVEAGGRLAEAEAELLEAITTYAESRFREPHRSIFRLRFEEGLTLREIALRLDMNLKTVFKYLSQSVNDIRTQFRR